MPHGLEYIVRPYQSPGRNAFLIPSAPGASNQRATITWGADATIPEPKGIGFNVVCCKEQLDEQSRQSDTVQIPIQDDANYVEVQRPNTVSLNKKENNTCGDDWDQFSGVGAEISADFASLGEAIHSGTTSTGGNCQAQWKLKNQ